MVLIAAGLSPIPWVGALVTMRNTARKNRFFALVLLGTVLGIQCGKLLAGCLVDRFPRTARLMCGAAAARGGSLCSSSGHPKALGISGVSGPHLLAVPCYGRARAIQPVRLARYSSTAAAVLLLCWDAVRSTKREVLWLRSSLTFSCI